MTFFIGRRVAEISRQFTSWASITCQHHFFFHMVTVPTVQPWFWEGGIQLLGSVLSGSERQIGASCWAPRKSRNSLLVILWTIQITCVISSMEKFMDPFSRQLSSDWRMAASSLTLRQVFYRQDLSIDNPDYIYRSSGCYLMKGMAPVRYRQVQICTSAYRHCRG